MTKNWEPTAAFAALACQASFDERALDRLRTTKPGDVRDLVAYCRRHRVEGLVWDSIARMPEVIAPQSAAELSGLAADVGARNLQVVAEMRRLRDAFHSAAVDHLFIKGLALSTLCYRRPLTKTGRDIDLLVDQVSLSDAAGLLSRLGYRCVEPVGARSLDRWHQRKIESVWLDPVGESVVDLHTRLVPFPALLHGVGMQSARQTVSLGGIEFETLADAPLMAYLSVHGISSLWFRLKWLADFAGFAHRLGERLNAVAADAGALDTGRSLRLAFNLAGDLFGTPVPAFLSRESGAIDRWLERAALDQLVGASAMTEPTGSALGTLPIHAAGAAAGGSSKRAVAELARRAGDAVFHRIF